MSKTVTIPSYKNPYDVDVNGRKYAYRAGDTLEVPDEVAEVIEHDLDLIIEPLPVPKPGGGSGGGTGGSSEIEEQWIRAIEGDYYNPATKLPDGVTKIGDYAFYYNNGLAVTSLPASVTSIGDYAFYSSSALALTALPAGLTSIGSYAFYFCSQMTLKSIPASIETIKSRAFQSCQSLTEITFNGTPTTIASDAFRGCSDLLTINVPWAEGEVANAPWGADYATINYNYTGG